METLTVEQKLERLNYICSQLEQENNINFWKTQKYILEIFKNPLNLLAEETDESKPIISYVFDSFRVKSKRRDGTSYLADKRESPIHNL